MADLTEYDELFVGVYEATSNEDLLCNLGRKPRERERVEGGLGSGSTQCFLRLFSDALKTGR